MSVKKRCSEGFTLIEVLIVVVIIAILAALVIPRMLSQTTKASAAEAISMVNTIKRQAERTYDLEGSYPLVHGALGPLFLFIGSNGAQSPLVTNFGNWASIGIQGPESSTKWSYSLMSFGNYFSVLVCNRDLSSGASYISPEAESGVSTGWFCNGVFTNDGDASKPCRIA